jgi:hypothetical protein
MIKKILGCLRAINQNNQAVTAKIEFLFGCPNCIPLLGVVMVRLELH